MAATLAESGITHSPEAKALDQFRADDVAKFARISGGELSTHPQRPNFPTGISFQDGNEYISFENDLGIYRGAEFTSEEGRFRLPTPAILFGQGEVIVVCPGDTYDGGQLVNRTITFSGGKAVVKDLSAEDMVSSDPDITRAIEVAEGYRLDAESRAEEVHRSRMRKAFRRK